MYCTDFEYDRKRLSEYNMIICSFQGASGVESVSSGADITFNQGKASGFSRFYLYSSGYDSAYITTFQICKDPCKFHDNNLFLSTREVSAIQKWLCRNSYHKFKIDQDDYRDIYWNAVFSSKQILLNGRIVGLELTMCTDAPYAYRDEICHEFDCMEDKSFTIFNLSDKEGYIYPDLELTVLQPGENEFILSFDGRESRINHCHENEVITINGGSHIISSSLSETEHDIAKDFNFIFPKIKNTYEDHTNSFSVNLDCTIKLKYSPIILIGL